MRWTILWGVLLFCGLFAPVGASAEEPGGAAFDWRAEFEAVCSQTDASMSLADETLVDLIARCDRLSVAIGSEPEVVRRVFLKRLQRCRDLFAYVLESRKARAVEQPAAPAAAPASPGAP